MSPMNQYKIGDEKVVTAYRLPLDTKVKEGQDIADIASFITPSVEDVVSAVDAQYRKWGVQDHPDTGVAGSQYLIASQDTLKGLYDKCGADVDWTTILLEEVAEAIEETDEEAKITELAQVAAVAIAWMDQIARRRMAREMGQ